MKAPDFWWRTAPSTMARLLNPLGRVYGALTARRMARPGRVSGMPVICVGNLVVGGAGKTPVTMTLAAMLLDDGRRPAILSRGYGGTASRSAGTLRVDPDRHHAALTGDEPLLLAAVAPTYVGRDRAASARQAQRDGADILLLDDGLQNPALGKTFSIAVVDGAAGFGNGLCLPAGPLRAPLERQWPHVSACCIVGCGERGETAANDAARHGVPVWRARLEPDDAVLARLKGQPLFAFAGIGRPEKFFATLRDSGLDLRGQRSFPDHHPFNAAELAELREAATRCGARLVTTAKDRVRLPRDESAEVLPVRLVFDEPSVVSDAVRTRTTLGAEA